MMIRNAFADAFTNALWVQKTLEGAWVRGVNWHMRMTAQTSARRRLSRKVKILLIVLAALLLIGGALLFYFERTIGYKSYSDDLVFTSPDGQYRLTVCEWTYFAYSGAELYVGRTADGGRGREAGTTFSDSPNGGTETFISNGIRTASPCITADMCGARPTTRRHGAARSARFPIKTERIRTNGKAGLRDVCGGSNERQRNGLLRFGRNASADAFAGGFDCPAQCGIGGYQ